jgi:hypothetical protein
MEPPKIETPLEDDPEMEAKLTDEEKAQLPPEPEHEALPDHIAQQTLPQTEQLILPPKRSRAPMLAGLFILVLLGAAATAYFLTQTNKKPAVSVSQTTVKKSTVTSNLPGVQLVSGKDYGNKYASGLLPVGDGKSVTDAPKAGYVYACAGYANNLKADQGGAGTRGPWFTNNNTQYDINKKLHVQGVVTWQASFSNKISGAARTIITNDLPNHTTGVFPISAADPAYAYDRNPNSIKGQTLTYSLNSGPAYGTPKCMGGQAGIMLTGVALFNGFDAGGRDAGAWEVQDSCDGHPQKEGEYHYHTLSSCIKDVSVKTVIGFGLDGFPITGPQVAANNILTTADLDECHGLTSQVVLDGKNVTMYHYVMTEDFPYSISCFRSTAIQPPGQPAAQPQP